MVHVTDRAPRCRSTKHSARKSCTAARTAIGCWPTHPNPEQNEGKVELSIQATVPLDQIEERLRAAGAPITQPVQEVGFGRQLQLTSPDGLPIKIDELDPNQFS